jgi:putative Mn2+ efflux pump MntP
MAIALSFIAVAIIGLVHGLEPGHGWPIAALASFRRGDRYAYGALASLVIALAHFVSSIVVLLVYYIAAAFIDFSSPYFRYLVAAVLLILAARMFMEKVGNGEDGRIANARSGQMSLRDIAIFALVLGFAHEEEFMLLALAVGGVSPLYLMLSYAGAVTVSMVGTTLLAIRAYSLVEKRIRKYEGYIPKVTGLVFVILAVLFLLGVY